ncbi:MAG: putative Sensor histidine kinase, partial [Pedosphaera sp.]|nr:putative Sensor histidine kinase [Pedosphaera sp.]
MGSNFNKFIVLIFSLAVILVVVIGAVDYYSTKRLIHTSARVAHTHEVLEDLESLLSELSTAEGGSRGYIITGNKAFLESYDTALARVDEKFKSLREITSDNPLQQARVAKLEPLVISRVAMLKDIVKLRTEKGFESAQEVVSRQRGKNVMDQIRSIAEYMKSEEELLLRRRTERTNATAAVATRFSQIGGFVGLLLLVIPFYLLQQEIKKRQRIQKEVTTLNQYLEERATQLESANKELEAFSYSVSHDLRAPIRHISGFVDLLSKQESITHEPKTGRYLKFISDSARQMGKLVDDLLSFSRMSRTEMQIGNVELAGLVKETREELASSWSGRLINWHTDKLPEVRCDASM